MRTLVDDALRCEAARCRLRFGCEDCAHLDVERGACAEGFPNAAHRAIDLERVSSLEFCKSFELS